MAVGAAARAAGSGVWVVYAGEYSKLHAAHAYIRAPTRAGSHVVVALEGTLMVLPGPVSGEATGEDAKLE